MRERLMSRDPMAWLVCRERWQSLILWLLTVTLLIAFAAARFAGIPEEAWAVIGYLSGGLFLFFYLGAASQSCRFFIEARRSGLIELLLATPLKEDEVVRGHWRALVRMFAPPVLIFLGLEFALSMLKENSMWRLTAGEEGIVNSLIIVGSALKSILVTVFNLVALCWFGMWMGMTSRSANLATLKTLLFVQIIPWLVITFVSYIVVSITLVPWVIKAANNAAANSNASTITRSVAWFPLLFAVVMGVLSVIKDVVFINIARNRLLKNFRAVAVKAVLPIQISVVPPPLPRNCPPALS